MLIGDPKQAIYAFRGADVVSYLDADAAGRRRTPRSPATGAATPALLRALEHRVRRRGARRRADRRAAGGGGASRCRRLRGRAVSTRRCACGSLPRDGLARSGRGATSARRGRPATWSPATWPRTSPRCSAPGRRSTAGDRCGPATSPCWCARTTRARLVRDALAAVGVPAVLSGTASVFGTPAARGVADAAAGAGAAAAGPDPRRRADLLPRADGRPSCAGPRRPTRRPARRAGRHAARAGPAVLHGGASPRCWRRSPPAPACPRGCSPRTDGERRLTDLRHVGAGAARRRRRRAPRARRRWSSGCATASTRPRRTSGSSAAGGWSPTPRPCRSSPCTAARAWSSRSSTCRSGGTATCPASRTCRCCTTTPARGCCDVGGAGGAGLVRSAAPRHEAEEAGEDLRLLYVALTRARCQVVPGGCRRRRRATSPLHRLLFGRRGPGATPAGVATAVPNDTAALTALRGAGGRRSGGRAGARPAAGVVHARSGRRRRRWRRRAFTRTLDLAWRRTSYSALTAGVHGGHARRGDRARGAGDGRRGPGAGRRRRARRRRARIGGGRYRPHGDGRRRAAAVGGAATRRRRRRSPSRPPWPTCPSAPGSARWCTPCSSRPTSPRRTCEPSSLPLRPHRAGSATPLPAVDPDALADALVARRPHPARPARRRPRPRRHRARRPARRARLRAAARRRRHPRRGRRGSATSSRCCAATCPADDPLAALPRPASPTRFADQPLRGYLTGSIDAVLRLPGPSGTPSSTTRPTGSARSGRTAGAADRRRTTPPTGSPRR